MIKLGLDFKSEDNTLFVDVKGYLDINTSNKFKLEIIENLKENKNIVLNCEELEYVDSNGLGSFISIYKNLKERNGDLIIKGLKSHIKKIFVITDLDKVFKIEE